MTRVSGTGNQITFTADADNVEVVLPSGSTSGYVGTPGMFGIHSIECPPLPKYFSLLQDYLFSDQNASVQYLRAGSRRGQSVPEQVWAWGMGMPASKHTTHNEQTGYASMSRDQWLGLESAVGSYFVNPNGNQVQFTSEMAQCMRDQMDGLAADYADWCHRHQFTPHMGDQAEILRGCDGEAVGCAFFHYQASKLPGTTTSHHDPGEGSYPEDVFLAKALAAFSGRTGGSTPATPTIPLTPDAPAPVLVFPPPPPKEWSDMASKEDIQAAIAAALKAEVHTNPSGWNVFSPNGRGIGASANGSRVWSGLTPQSWQALQKACAAAGQTYLNWGSLPSDQVLHLFGKQV